LKLLDRELETLLKLLDSLTKKEVNELEAEVYELGLLTETRELKRLVASLLLAVEAEARELVKALLALRLELLSLLLRELWALVKLVLEILWTELSTLLVLLLLTLLRTELSTLLMILELRLELLWELLLELLLELWELLLEPKVKGASPGCADAVHCPTNATTNKRAANPSKVCLCIRLYLRSVKCFTIYITVWKKTDNLCYPMKSCTHRKPLAELTPKPKPFSPSRVCKLFFC